MPARTLIDTGAIHNNYVSSNFASKLRASGVIFTPHKLVLCSYNNNCQRFSTGSATCKVGFRNALSNEYEYADISVQIVDGLAYDCIIGRPTIQRYKLVSKLAIENACHNSDTCSASCCAHINCVCKSCSCGDIVSSAHTREDMHSIPRKVSSNTSREALEVPIFGGYKAMSISDAYSSFDQRVINLYSIGSSAGEVSLEKPLKQCISSVQESGSDATNPLPEKSPTTYVRAQPLNLAFIPQGVVDAKELFFYDPSELAGEFDPFRNIEDEPWADRNDTSTDAALNASERIFLKAELLPVWQKIRARFASTLTDQLSAEPAKLDPFELKIDVKKWEVNSNRRPCRPQTVENDEQIRTQVTRLLELGILQHTRDAAFYSHPHMVRKKTGDKKRFTVDFRFLNECCGGLAWPIPNMDLLLERIGRQSP